MAVDGGFAPSLQESLAAPDLMPSHLPTFLLFLLLCLILLFTCGSLDLSFPNFTKARPLRPHKFHHQRLPKDLFKTLFYNRKKAPLTAMPNQVSTPRTTRNSRGLRQSPEPSSKPAGISKRRRISGSPTPTTNAQFLGQSSQPAQAPALQPIQEEEPHAGTPTSVAPPAATRPQVFPPPIALLPAARPAANHATTNSPPWTPVRLQIRYRNRYIERTPPPPPTPKSPGCETRRFRQRRDKEGDEKFARELYQAIRNDHHMRSCWCGLPMIYNSREEAEAGSGHLRFYVEGFGPKTLRVIQKKDDLRWHCICGNLEYPAAYKNLINDNTSVNANGKRPAEDSEIDLIAQNQGTDSAESVERVLPGLAEPVVNEEESPLAQSMWAQARDIVSRAVATMGGSALSILGKIRQQLRGDAYETIDTRRQDAQNGTIIVKRVKRQARGPPTKDSPSDQASDDDGFENLMWTDDPTKRIGLEQIQCIAQEFANQLKSIETGNLIGGASVAAIQLQIQPGQDLGTSIAIHKYQEQEYGPMMPGESDRAKADKLVKALKSYSKCLNMSIDFMRVVYDPALFHELKEKHKTLPRRLELGGVEFRQGAKTVGEFLCFIQSLKSVCAMEPVLLEAICKMIVDANAIHKKEMVPSFVELKLNPIEGMPGFFPEDKKSILEELSADELNIQPLYDFRYPSPEPSDKDESEDQPGDYRLVSKPKGILKPSREWVDAPASPKYVPTPQKKRKIAFHSPVSNFTAPSHIPARVMTPYEAERLRCTKLLAEVLGDEHSKRLFEAAQTVSRPTIEDQLNPEIVRRDEREMGLAYHARKYGSFLEDLQTDMVEREEEKEERKKLRFKPSPIAVRIPLPPLPSDSTQRRRRDRTPESSDTDSPPPSPFGAKNPFLTRPPEPKPKRKTEPVYASLEEFFATDQEGLLLSRERIDQVEIYRQIRDEFEAGLRRQVEEKRQREIEEEERRKQEERRKEEEARRRKEADELAVLTGLRRPNRSLITRISDEWDSKVRNAANANPSTELVKTLEGQPLTRRDFEEKLLPPTAWLNDNVIIGSILYISDYVNNAKGASNQEPKCAALTSYFWPRLLSHGPSGCGRLLRRASVRKANFFDLESILIPICDNAHWTLAVIRPQKRQVAHLDSLRAGRGHDDVKAKLLELVRFILEDQFVESEWSALDFEAPRQTNGWDCGVFTITNAMCIALGLNPTQSYTENQLLLQRRRIAAVLLNEGFKGEFSLDGL